MADLSNFVDFMDESDEARGGFLSPLMPSPAYPAGKQYAVPSPDARVGLRLAALADLTLKQSRGATVTDADVKRLRLDDKDEREFLEQVLSNDIMQQMLDDGVKWAHLKRLAMYAFVFFAVSREAADKAAEDGLFSGKAVASTNRAGRRSKKKIETTSDLPASKKTKSSS